MSLIVDEVYHQPFLKKTIKHLEVIQEVVLPDVSKLNELVPCV